QFLAFGADYLNVSGLGWSSIVAGGSQRAATIRRSDGDLNHTLHPVAFAALDPCVHGNPVSCVQLVPVIAVSKLLGRGGRERRALNNYSRACVVGRGRGRYWGWRGGHSGAGCHGHGGEHR